MSVEVTRLPSGLIVVTDDMPHLQTASLGVWTGAGSRDEHDGRARHRASCSNTWRSRERGGAPRSQIAEEIEAVGGDINAATSNETHRLLRAHAQRRRAAGARRALRHPLRSGFDPTELEREKNVIVQEIGAAEDTPDDLVFEFLQGTAYPDQPVGRSILGTPGERALVRRRRSCAPISTRNYKAPDMVVGAAGAVEHAAHRRRGERSASRASRARRRRRRSRRASSAARGSSRATSSRCTSPSRWKACRSAIRRFTACTSSPTCSAAACRRACSSRCASSAASATRSTRSTGPISDTGTVRPLRRHRRGATPPS